MSSGSKKVTVGYWYRMLFGYGWCKGPIDAFLEMRGGGRTAWKGLVTQTSRIYVNALNLWGGEKKEGGLQGYFDVQLGEADQGVNDYLQTRLGRDQPTYRGKAIGVWRGGRYGAMNPYPKRLEFKLRRILRGWDNDECWYAEKAEVIPDQWRLNYDQDGWRYRVESPGSSANYSSRNYDDSSWLIGRGGFGSGGPGAGLGVGTYISAGVTGRGIWIRREVMAPAAGVELLVDVYHDDGAWLWWNGQAVALQPTGNYFHSIASIPPALVTARNIVVLKVLDGVPGGSPSHIYAGLTIRRGASLIGMNPAHILYDSLTASDMQGEPVGMINEESFIAAADQLFNEGFGLCTIYDPDAETIEEFQQRICNVIGGSLTQSRINGQYYLDLIRDDNTEDLPIITADDILELKWEPVPLTELVNQITVEWFDPERKEHRSTPPVQSLGAIQAAGRVIPEVMRYPEIPAENLALRVAGRDLQARSTPLIRFSLTVNRRRGIWALRHGKRFRLQSPQDGFADIVCVLGDIDVGTLTSGRITIKAVQDVFGMPDTVYVEAEAGQAPPQNLPPAASPHQRMIEAPYVELVANMSSSELTAFPDDAGAIMAMASQPLSGLNYSLWSGAEGAELEDNGSGDWCPVARVVEEANYLDTEFTLTAGSNLEDVVVGSWALWDEEIVRVDAIDAEANTVTLGRGCADTVPARHDAGSRIWFCGDWAGTDDREYVDGEIVTAKLLTRASIAELPLDAAPALTLEMQQRQFRPYPPAGLLINSQAYPGAVNGDVEIMWVPRDRVMQADKLFDTTAGGIGPEPGVTYDVRCYIDDVLDDSASALSTPGLIWVPSIPAGIGRVEVRSVRGSIASLQAATHEFSLGAELWTPAHLGNPAKVWLDDTSEVTDVSGNCSQWNDKSGNGWHFSQGEAAQRPEILLGELNDRRALRFDGVNDKLIGATGARSIFRNTTVAWLFAVYKKRAADSSATHRTLFRSNTNGPGVRFAVQCGSGESPGDQNKIEIGTRRLDSDSFNRLVSSGTHSGQWIINLDIVNYATGLASIAVDGVIDGSASTVSSGSTSNTDSSIGLVLGAYHPSFAGREADIDIAVLIIGSGALPAAADQQRLEGWAAWRYGLVDNLPVDHPYKTEPPTL